MSTVYVGIDLAQNVFALHGVNATRAVQLRQPKVASRTSGRPGNCFTPANGKWRDPGAAARPVQRMVESARPGQRERAVVQGPGLHRVRENFVERANLVVPPTADPHGGWCGGWELETPGYPFRLHGCSPPVYIGARSTLGT